MELVLIRHAQTTSNVARALDTALPGADLTPLGEEQIAAVGEALAGDSFDAIFSSPATRALRTAAAVAGPHALEPHVRPGLAEISAGEYEMSTEHAHWIGYRDLVSAWFDGELHHELPGGETGHAALARFDEVIDEITALHLGRVAIVSHGGMIRAWVTARAGNVTAEHARSHPLSNTGIVRVIAETDGWLATSWDGIPLA